MAKPASARQRRNKTSTATALVLIDRDTITLPPMPALRRRVEGALVEREWHSEAVLAWAEMWSSPMVTEYLEADLPLIHAYLACVHDYWDRVENGKSLTEAGKLMLSFAERFGIGPDSRRRLQWTVETAKEAMSRGRTREMTEANVIEGSAIDVDAAWGAIADGEDE